MKTSVLVMALLATGSAYATQKTTVPAFFGLLEQSDSTFGSCASQGGAGCDWTRIANEGGAVLATVALGDSGGFEDSPNSTLQTNAQNQFYANSHNSNNGGGQLVLGYVKAGFACTATGNLSTRYTYATSDASHYGVAEWYSYYPTQIQGIFYDIGPQLSTCPSGTDLAGQSPQSESTQQTYYSNAYNYVHNNHSGAKVMLNASQFEHNWIVSTNQYKAADYAVIFERDYNTWSTTSNYKAEDGSSPSWWTSGYSGQLANVIYGADQYDAQNGVSQSQGATYGSPVVYFYDGSSTSYDHVSCSFETQVALLQNQSSVPTASTYCSGACADLDTDSNNCGSCGNYCTGAGQQCNTGACMVDCGNDCWMYTQADCYTNCN